MKIIDLKFPEYDDLDDNGYYETEAKIRVNNMDVICWTGFSYTLEVDKGDRDTPDDNYALLSEIYIPDWDFYDSDNMLVDLHTEDEAMLILKIEKFIESQTNDKL